MLKTLPIIKIYFNKGIQYHSIISRSMMVEEKAKPRVGDSAVKTKRREPHKIIEDDGSSDEEEKLPPISVENLTEEKIPLPKKQKEVVSNNTDEDEEEEDLASYHKKNTAFLDDAENRKEMIAKLKEPFTLDDIFPLNMSAASRIDGIMLETTIYHAVTPIIERAASKINVQLVESERMSEEVKKRVQQHAAFVEKLRMLSNKPGIVKTFIALSTGLAILGFIYKVGLYREIPKIINVGIEMITEVASNIKVIKDIPVPAPSETLSKTSEWLYAPTISPTEVLLFGTTIVSTVLILKGISFIKKFVK